VVIALVRLRSLAKARAEPLAPQASLAPAPTPPAPPLTPAAGETPVVS
jgi:hypothetical protein